MTTPTTQSRNANMQHLKDILAGDLAAHLQAEHGHNGDLPTSKPQLARLHAEHHTSKPEPKAEPAKTEPKAAAKPAAARAARKTGNPAADRAANSAKAAPAEKPATPATPEEMAAEIERLRAELAAKPTKATKATKAEPTGPTKSDAKQDLARRLVLAISGVFESADGSEAFLTGMTRAEAAQCAANWVHHFPTGKADDGQRWWGGVLPKPDRSDWR